MTPNVYLEHLYLIYFHLYPTLRGTWRAPLYNHLWHTESCLLVPPSEMSPYIFRFPGSSLMILVSFYIFLGHIFPELLFSVDISNYFYPCKTNVFIIEGCFPINMPPKMLKFGGQSSFLYLWLSSVEWAVVRIFFLLIKLPAPTLMAHENKI